ncbi:hypothetical protein HPB49_010252 [Dermacentor silvarum]|uniref:Uncharacterized protein n=1 Tax=Dermacentor silvarum TaxID=543639 RepID=A0ACB8C2Y3_DERSI|nr:hypothetical protein HPB49_010252 [Dermacentor silvarum]
MSLHQERAPGKKMPSKDAEYSEKKPSKFAEVFSAKNKAPSLTCVQAAADILKMQVKNSRINEEVFKTKIERLSPKQKQATHRIFAAVKRKGMKGMVYSKEWMLECIIMKMKVPKLYEQMRKQQILVLPSKVTLHKYTKEYRTGFGFSRKVFSVLKEKTSSMDVFKRHGGQLVDEMKFSENLSVTPGGHIDGMIRDLIEIMTSRFPAKALRPGSVAEDQLLSFLAYLTEWELHAGEQVGVRVTVSRTEDVAAPRVVFFCEDCGELFPVKQLLHHHRQRDHPLRRQGKYQCTH